MNKQTIISIVIISVALIVGLIILQVESTKKANMPGEYDQLATCLGEQGAVFYGAFWCPHCNNQKDMFGKSERLLPYVECSTPDGAGQTQECIDMGIQSYPTWIFADGSRLTGEIALETLAEKTGCEATLSGNESESFVPEAGESSEAI